MEDTNSIPTARFEVVIQPKTVLKVAATVFALRVASAMGKAFINNTAIPAMNRTLDKLEQARTAALDDE